MREPGAHARGREVWSNSATWLWYFATGEIKIRLRERPGTPEFAVEYAAACARAEAVAGGSGEGETARPKAGTLRWLCVAYFRSAEFQRLDASTQRARRRILESCVAEPIARGARETFGDFPLKRLTGKALRVLRDRKAHLPEAATGRLKALRRMFSWALEYDLLETDPARDVRRLPHATTGYHSWTIEEVERYESRHPIGSKARLALALLMYTGARRSDAVVLGPQHVKNGWIKFVAQKNRNRRPVTVELPVPPALAAIIEASVTGTLTFLVTEYGKPFTAAGFSGWFRARCDEGRTTALLGTRFPQSGSSTSGREWSNGARTDGNLRLAEPQGSGALHSRGSPPPIVSQGHRASRSGQRRSMN